MRKETRRNFLQRSPWRICTTISAIAAIPTLLSSCEEQGPALTPTPDAIRRTSTAKALGTKRAIHQETALAGEAQELMDQRNTRTPTQGPPSATPTHDELGELITTGEGDIITLRSASKTATAKVAGIGIEEEKTPVPPTPTTTSTPLPPTATATRNPYAPPGPGIWFLDQNGKWKKLR